MAFNAVNWLAVIVCLVVSMVSGSLWYNPKTFYPVWKKGIGTPENKGIGATNMPLMWGLTMLSSFVQAVAMALMVNAMGGLMGGVTWLSGAGTGFMLWLGFIAPTYLVNKLFAEQSLKIWAIEIGNHLVNFVLFGAILGAWR